MCSSDLAIADTKALLRAVAERTPDDARALTTAALAARRASAEGQLGVRTFLDKQRPSWHTTP